jgi:hypothetical protein
VENSAVFKGKISFFSKKVSRETTKPQNLAQNSEETEHKTDCFKYMRF